MDALLVESEEVLPEVKEGGVDALLGFQEPFVMHEEDARPLIPVFFH